MKKERHRGRVLYPAINTELLYWIMDYFKAICPHCGASFHDEWIYDEQQQWNYCPNCGTKLNWREEDLVKKGD